MEGVPGPCLLATVMVVSAETVGRAEIPILSRAEEAEEVVIREPVVKGL